MAFATDLYPSINYNNLCLHFAPTANCLVEGRGVRQKEVQQLKCDLVFA